MNLKFLIGAMSLVELCGAGSVLAGVRPDIAASGCRGANYRCTDAGQSIEACLFDDFMVVSRGEKRVKMKVRKVAPPPKIAGAPFHVTGRDVDLTICTTCTPLPEGQSGQLFVGALQIFDQSVNCRSLPVSRRR